MVTRVSKARNPLSANGQGSSGDALLHTRAWRGKRNAQADAHRQKTAVGKRQTQKTLTVKQMAGGICLKQMPGNFPGVDKQQASQCG
jgi:hypothetical protein